jgi:hypothetical protein
MATAIQPIIISPSLAINPALNFRLWRINLAQQVAALQNEEFGIHGLLFLILPPPTYANLPGAISPENWSLIRPNWEDNFTANARQKYIFQKAAVDDLVKHNTAIRNAMLNSIGPALAEEIINPLYNYVTLTPREILAFLDNRFPLEGPSVIQTLRSDLQRPAPGSDPTSFSNHVTTFKATIRHLAQAGQVYPPEWILDQFISTCTGQPPLIDAISDYLKSTATPTAQIDRSVAAITSFIQTRLEEPHIGTVFSAARFGGSAHAAATTITSPAPTQRAAAPSTVKPYCYHHGPCGHTGTDCQHMASNPTLFTSKMKRATHPKDVPRGVTWGKQKSFTRT